MANELITTNNVIEAVDNYNPDFGNVRNASMVKSGYVRLMYV